MNRADFKRLSIVRLREARSLLRAGHYDGAYYLAGYVVECAIKACIARDTKRYDFPDKNRANASWNHNLAALALTARLDVQQEIKSDPQFGSNWATVKDWTEESRYRKNDSAQAREIIAAITDRRWGVTVVKTVLVEHDIEDGQTLLATLDQANVSLPYKSLADRVKTRMLSETLVQASIPKKGFRVRAALWLYSGDSPEWRLVIATPLVEEFGTRSTYAEIQRVLNSLSPPLGLTLENISVVKPKDPFVKTLGRALRVGPTTGVRFARNTIGDTYVEDSYIYRLSRAA